MREGGDLSTADWPNATVDLLTLPMMTALLLSWHFLTSSHYPLTDSGALTFIGVTLLPAISLSLAVKKEPKLELFVYVIVWFSLALFFGTVLAIATSILSFMHGIGFLESWRPTEVHLPLLIVTTIGVCCVVLITSVILRQHASRFYLIVIGTAFLTVLVGPDIGRRNPQVVNVENENIVDLPPFLIVFLDAQIGLGGIPEEIPGATETKEEWRKVLADFTTFDNAYTRTPQTQMSIAALLNFAQTDDDYGERYSDSDIFLFELKQNRLAKKLREEGYVVSIVQNQFFNMCTDHVTQCISLAPNDLSYIADSNLSTWQKAIGLLSIFTKQWHDADDGNFSPGNIYDAFDNAEQVLEEHQRGHALIFHVLIPHDPLILDQNCILMPAEYWQMLIRQPREKSLEKYLRQSRCAAKKVAGLFDVLKTNGVWTDSRVFIIGDHGTRLVSGSDKDRMAKMSGSLDLTEDDKKQIFSAMFAVKAPNLGTYSTPTPIEIQNGFAYFLGHEKHLVVPGPSYGTIRQKFQLSKFSNYRRILLPPQFQGN